MSTSLKLTQEEDNFWKLCMVNLIIAPNAVRTYFDCLVAPQDLPNTINQNIANINNLFAGRVINQTQLDILQKIPGTVWTSSSIPVPSSVSGTSSKDFDLSLLVCLLRNIVGIPPPSTRRWDVIPPPNDKSPGAHLVRLKVYRNELAHATETTMGMNEFNYKLQNITEAVKFFNGGQSPPTLADILNCDLDGSVSAEKVSRLSSQINEIKEEYELVKQEYETELKEREDRMKQIKSELTFHKEGSLPKNISDQIDVTLEQWRENDVPFFETRAAKDALQIIKSTKSIIIVGNSGSGKTALARHLALFFCANGYQLVPIDDPDEMCKYRCKTVKQIFVIDDVIGKYSISHASLNKWERLNEKIISKLFPTEKKYSEDLILVCTLRTHIAGNEQFKMSETILNRSIVDIAKMDNTLSSTEKQSMLWNHLVYTTKHESVNGTDLKSICDIQTCISFPLLCQLFTSNNERFRQGIEFFKRPMAIVQDEISKLYYKNREVYCTLVICSALSGRLDANMFDVSQPIDQLGMIQQLVSIHLPPNAMVNLVVEACGLNCNLSRQVLLESIVSVEGTFVFRNSRNEFEFMHDFHREVISIHFSSVNFPVFIELYDIDFITKVLVVDKNELTGSLLNEAKILVQEKNYVALSRRFISEIKIGKFYPILTSQPMKHERFVNILGITINNEYSRSQILRSKCFSTYVSAKRSNKQQNTLNIDAIEYMNRVSSSGSTLFNWILVTGCQPFFIYFWNHMSKREKNQYTGNTFLSSRCQSVLCYAVLGENCKIVETLIKAGASINKVDEDGRTPLSIAVRLGNHCLVSLLMRNGCKVGMREKTTRMSAINIAAKKGCASLLNLLLQKDKQQLTPVKYYKSIQEAKEIDMMQWAPQSVLGTACINVLMSIEVLPYSVYLHDIDIPDINGNTPLHSAVSGSVNSVVTLPENCATNDELTADCVHILVEHGASPFLRNNNGLTAACLSNLYGQRGKIYNFDNRNISTKIYIFYMMALMLCLSLLFVFLSIPYFLFEASGNRISRNQSDDRVCYTEEEICEKERIAKFEYYEFLLLFFISVTLGLNSLMLILAKTYNIRCKNYVYRRWVNLLGIFCVFRVGWYYASYFTLLYKTSSLLLIVSDQIFYLILFHITFYFLIYGQPFILIFMYYEFTATDKIWNPQIFIVSMATKYDSDHPTHGIFIKYLLTCPIFARADLENMKGTYTSDEIFLMVTFVCVILAIFCFIHVLPAILLAMCKKRNIKWLPVSIIFSVILLFSVKALFSVLELPCKGRNYDVMSYAFSKYEETLICKKELCRTEYKPVAIGKEYILHPLFTYINNPKYHYTTSQ